MWDWNPESVTAVATAIGTGALALGLIFAVSTVLVAAAQVRAQTRATRAAIMLETSRYYASTEMLKAIEYLMDRNHPERRDPFQYLKLVFGEDDFQLHDSRRRLSQFLDATARLVSNKVESEEFALALLGSAIEFFEVLAPIEYRLQLRTRQGTAIWPLADLYIRWRSRSDRKLRRFLPAEALSSLFEGTHHFENLRMDREDADLNISRRHRRFLEDLASRAGLENDWARLTLGAVNQPPSPEEMVGIHGAGARVAANRRS